MYECMYECMYVFVCMCVDLRVIVGPRDVDVYNRGLLRHDDVLIVPDFFCREDDWDIYYRLIDEMRHSQAQGTKNADWIRYVCMYACMYVCICSYSHRCCCCSAGTRVRT